MMYIMRSNYLLTSFKCMRSIHCCCLSECLKMLGEFGEFVYMLTACYHKELQSSRISYEIILQNREKVFYFIFVF
jgi:hypothetical protein